MTVQGKQREKNSLRYNRIYELPLRTFGGGATKNNFETGWQNVDSCLGR